MHLQVWSWPSSSNIYCYNYGLAASNFHCIFAISLGASFTVGGLVLRSDGLARPLIGQLVSHLYCKVVGIILALSRKLKIRFLNPGNSMTIFIIPETSLYIDKTNKSPLNLFGQYVGFLIFLNLKIGVLDCGQLLASY